MSSFKNAIPRRAHKERAQPSSRKKFGLLEKHKDYVVRAKAFHKKEETIRKLKEKAAFRNPDEFYFKMIRSRVVDGVHRFEDMDASRSSSDSEEPQHIVNIFQEGELFDEAVQQEQGEDGQPNRVRPRGRTTMKTLKLRLKNNDWQPLPIEFNDKGKAIGSERCAFPSYIGYLARAKVPITLRSWDHVSISMSKMFWWHMRNVYQIPKTKQYKKLCFDNLRLRWKDYKYSLTKKFVRTGRNPLTIYRWITPEQWAEFVASRDDPQFHKESERNQRKREANIYPHLLSRGGYTLLEDKLKRKKFQELKEASNSDPSVVLEVPANIERQELWLKTDLEEQHKQGSFVQSGRMDILTTAIGKPDHRGHVRGQPTRVGIRQYFRSSSSRRSSQNPEDLKQMEARIAKDVEGRVRADLMDDMQRLMGELMAKARADAVAEYIAAQSLATPISSKGSNDALRVVPLTDPPAADDDDGVSRATLCLDDPRPRVVAHAMVFFKAASHHHMPIPDDCRRVSVTRVVEGEERTALARPEIGEVEVLADAVGTFILWPRHLIRSIARQERAVREMRVRNPHWERFKTTYKTIGSTSFQLPPDIVQPHFTHTFYLGAKDYEEFVQMKDIDLSWLELAVWYCHDCCVQLERGHLYGFFSPSFITHHIPTSERKRHMLDAIKHTRRECYLAPLLRKTHWQLFVLFPRANHIMMLCSKGRNTIGQVTRDEFNSVLKGHRRNELHIQGTSNPTLDIVPAQKQPTEIECGYYVMFYMYTIIQSGVSTPEGIRSLFGDTESLADDDLDFIRDLICSKFFSVTQT